MVAQKIRKMSEYLEPKDIAQALQIPENIVIGILNKTLDPSILDDPKAEVKIITDDGYEISAMDASQFLINRRKEKVTQKIEQEIQKSKSSFSKIMWAMSIICYCLITVVLICFIADAIGNEKAGSVLKMLSDLIRGI